MLQSRGGESFENVGWTRGKIYYQKVNIMFFYIVFVLE